MQADKNIADLKHLPAHLKGSLRREQVFLAEQEAKTALLSTTTNLLDREHLPVQFSKPRLVRQSSRVFEHPVQSSSGTRQEKRTAVNINPFRH